MKRRTCYRSAGAQAAIIELVLGHFAAQRVPVDAEDFRGAGLIAVGTIEDAFDEALFKFADGLIEEDAALDHLQNQTL